MLTSVCLVLSVFAWLPSPITAFTHYDTSPHALQGHFNDWILRHNKQYHSFDEQLYRQQVFSDNLNLINQHNQLYSEGKSSFWLGPTVHSDLTNYEYQKKVLTGIRKDKTDKSTYQHLFQTFIPNVSAADLPVAVDWRKKGVVQQPKNQGQCGSCWSFSAIAALESAWAVHSGDLLDLSEQELVDCVNNGNDTCTNGGEMTDGFLYVIGNGIESESDYPYTASSGTSCQFNKKKSVAQFSAYFNVTQGDEKALAAAVAEHPSISVAIDASQFTFQLYMGGVYDDPSCMSKEETLDHGVSLVGYDVESDSKKSYWIVKNSWGQQWGQNGYIWMSKDNENQCGIATDASFPVV